MLSYPLAMTTGSSHKLLVLIALVVASCSKAPPPEAKSPSAVVSRPAPPGLNIAASFSPRPLPPIEADLSSPDKAVKTLFQYQDRRLLRRYEEQMFYRSQFRLPEDVAPASDLFEGAGKRYFSGLTDLAPAILPRFDRSIDKVEKESDTRAIVYVTQTAPTEIAGIAVHAYGPSLYEEDAKNKRTQSFRYVLSRTGSAWRIEDAQFYGTWLAGNKVKLGWKRVNEIGGAETPVTGRREHFLQFRPFF